MSIFDGDDREYLSVFSPCRDGRHGDCAVRVRMPGTFGGTVLERCSCDCHATAEPTVRRPPVDAHQSCLARDHEPSSLDDLPI